MSETRQIKRVRETRVRDGRIEGLVEYVDGTEEWRPPSRVEVEGKITRADGTVEHRTLNASVAGIA